MVFNDVAVNVDDAALNEGPTTFENLNNGIVGMNSSLLVQNSTFTTMKNFNSYTMPMNGTPGTGIFAGADYGKYGSLTQIGMGISSWSNTPPLTFNDCVVGMHTNNISTDISYNRMDGISYTGIRSENSGVLPIHIYLNQIGASIIGIHLSFNRLSRDLLVDQNSITSMTGQAGAGNYGIVYDGITPPPTGFYRIKNHDITCNNISGDFVYGMLITDMLGMGMVKNNTVDMTSSYMLDGIRVKASVGATFNSNSVFGYNIVKGKAYNFWLNNNLTISDNKSTGTRDGFSFYGPNSNTIFKTNEIGDPNASGPVHDIGVYLYSNAVIGLQYDPIANPIKVHNNRWISTGNNNSVYNSTFGAVNDNSNGAFAIMQSAFLVKSPVNTNNTIGSDIFPWFKTQISAVQWFDYFSGADIISDNYSNECEVFHAENNSFLTDLDRRTAHDSISCAVFEYETKIILVSDLIDKLETNESLRNSSTLYSDFYDSLQNTSTGQLSKVRFAIAAIDNYDEETEYQISKNDSLIHTLMLEKSIVDSNLNSSLSEMDSIAFVERSNNIIQNINSFTREIKELFTAHNSGRQSKIEDAKTLNDAIGTSNDIESNEKQINKIYLDTIVYGNITLNEERQGIIDAIAPQCPFTGGRAVFIARAIKRMQGDTTVYNDSAACVDAQNLRKSNSKNNPKNSEVRLSPNPAINTIKINYKLHENQVAFFRINDLTGREIYSCIINSDLTEKVITVSSLSTGFYLYYFKPEGEKESTGKITIIR